MADAVLRGVSAALVRQNAGDVTEWNTVAEIIRTLNDINESVYQQAGLAVKDGAANIAQGLGWGAEKIAEGLHLHHASGKDSEWGNRAAAWVDEWGKKAMRVADMGEFDIVSASGWRFQEGTIYNGAPLSKDEAAKLKGKPFSVFVYHKDGSYEVMTAGYREYAKYAGVYMVGQIAAGAVGGAAGVKTLAQEVIAAQGAVAKTGAALKGTAEVGFAASQGLSAGAIELGESLDQGLILSPMAVKEYAHLFDRKNLSPSDIKEMVGNIIFGFTGRSSSTAGNEYIPSPETVTDAVKILEQLSRNRLDGFILKHPNDPNPQHSESIHIDNLGNVFENPYFIRGMYGLMQKMLDGAKLSNTEQMLLRIGFNNVEGQGLSFLGKDKLTEGGMPVYNDQDYDELKGIAAAVLSKNARNKDGKVDPSMIRDYVAGRIARANEEIEKINLQKAESLVRANEIAEWQIFTQTVDQRFGIGNARSANNPEFSSQRNNLGRF